MLNIEQKENIILMERDVLFESQSTNILRNNRTYLKGKRLFLVFINQKGKRRAIH